ncbi:MAG: hypothetical protein WDN28_07025 [Chthoniobacter sp.]
MPYLQPDFWQPYPQARAADFAAFLALAKRGHAIDPFKAPAGSEPVVAEQEYQKGQLERAITYLRDKIGLGLKA